MLCRYGGVSVGGQLPVLGLQPQTIWTAAAQLGRLLNITGVCLYLSTCLCFLISDVVCNGPAHFLLQGKHSKQTLKDIGTFLRYMETHNNVKVE